MKPTLLLQMLSALVILSLVSRAQGNANREYDLALTIRCPQKNFIQGDEIPIVFTITNNDQSPYSYDRREYDRSGRLWEYVLTVTHRDGTRVPDPRENYGEGLGGGLSSRPGAIATGQSFSTTVALNKWALMNKPGRYTIVGTYSYIVRNVDAAQTHGIRTSRTIRVKSAPIEIVVFYSSPWRSGQYINSLIKDLKAITPSRKWDVVRQRTAIIAKLAYTCDDRIVPTLLDLMYNNHHNNEVFQAREAFLYHLPDDPMIKEALLQAAMTRGLAPGMQSPLERYGCTEQEFKEIISAGLASDDHDVLGEAVVAAQEHPDDEHMPRLIAIALETAGLSSEHHLATSNRHRAIHAISHNRTDDGVEALRALLEDADEGIRRSTQRSIRSAYRRHPIYPKVSDTERTAELVEMVLDLSNPQQIPAIMQICRSRTKEGVEALRILAEDPDRDLPIARTDAGVKAVSVFLKSPDKDIREMISGIVRGIYREYPGRPLRIDDFAEELQKPRPPKNNLQPQRSLPDQY